MIAYQTKKIKRIFKRIQPGNFLVVFVQYFEKIAGLTRAS